MARSIRNPHRSFAPMAVVAALCAGAAIASESTDVGIKGRIAPDTIVCRPTVWTTPNYGTFAASSLKPDSNGISVLSSKQLDISASCSKPSKFSIRFVDAHPGTAVADERFVQSISHGRPMGANLDKSYLFGLGQDSAGRNIGALLVESTDDVTYYYRNEAGQGQQGDGAWIESAGTGWVNRGTRTVLRPQKNYTVAQYGDRRPVANLLSMSLRGMVVPAIDTRAGHVNLKNEIKFNGRITVEVKQL